MNKISLIAAIFTIILSYSYASYENTPKFQVSKKFYRQEDSKFSISCVQDKRKNLWSSEMKAKSAIAKFWINLYSVDKGSGIKNQRQTNEFI
jgi:hypothetical protein